MCKEFDEVNLIIYQIKDSVVSGGVRFKITKIYLTLKLDLLFGANQHGSQRLLQSTWLE